MRTYLIRVAVGCLLIGAIAACSGSAASPTTPTATAPASSPDASAASPSAGGNAVTVRGIEYAYEGIPDNAPAGTVVTFENGGQEVHEIVAVRRNDGATITLDELLAKPEEELGEFVTFLGGVVAGPGETAPDTITLDQPGDYIFICFIPTGLTEVPSSAPGESPSESLPAGPPHVVQGMVAEFTVTQ